MDRTRIPFISLADGAWRKYPNVVLTTRSPSLLSKGWPAEIDLVNPEPGMLTTLQDLGLELKGLSANVDKMAILDFTKVLVNISHSETDEENNIYLDRNRQIE